MVAFTLLLAHLSSVSNASDTRKAIFRAHISELWAQQTKLSAYGALATAVYRYLLSRALQFGTDGGPALEYMAPKLAAFKGHVQAWTGLSLDVLPVEARRTLCQLLPAYGLSSPLAAVVDEVSAVEESKSHIASLPPQDKHALAVACALECLGGLLFVLNSAVGAQMLLMFIALVTP